MATKQRRIEEEQARVLWCAIREVKVTYNAMQDSLHCQEPEDYRIDLHNYDVAMDILYESFNRLLEFDPKDWD